MRPQFANNVANKLPMAAGRQCWKNWPILCFHDAGTARACISSILPKVAFKVTNYIVVAARLRIEWHLAASEAHWRDQTTEYYTARGSDSLENRRTNVDMFKFKSESKIVIKSSWLVLPFDCLQIQKDMYDVCKSTHRCIPIRFRFSWNINTQQWYE